MKIFKQLSLFFLIDVMSTRELRSSDPQIPANADDETSSMPKTAKKRKRSALRAEPKSENSLQWVNSELNHISNAVGHPVTQPFSYYSHVNILQLPFQPNVITSETIHSHFENPPWSTTYPVPLSTHRGVAKVCSKQLMLRLVKAKRSHLTILGNMKLHYKRKKPLLNKRMRQAHNVFPNIAFKVAEQINRDPDKWFSERYGYDYYFTSGSLAVIDCDQSLWVVNTVGEKMDRVEIVPANVIDGRLALETSAIKRYYMEADKGPIFETVWHVSDSICASSSKSVTNDGQLNVKIAFRRKHHIDILWTQTNFDKMKRANIRSKVPFISCSFQHRNSGWLMFTSDSEKVVKMWNCNQGEILGTLHLPREPSLEDCWSCVRPISKTFLICLDRTTLRLVEIVDNALMTIQLTQLKSWLWSCEKASSLEVCSKECLIFIGTTHKLLVLRIVKQGQENLFEFQHFITFTHNLKHYPTMIRFGADSSLVYHVWISSHLPGDTKLCSFRKVPPKRFVTKHLPLKPLTVQESNHLARTQGKCIYPAAVLKRRLQLFHSGIALIVDADHFHMLLQNSFGDIFHQRIVENPNELNAREIPARFHSWNDELNSFNVSQPPAATDFKNLRGFKRIFTCSAQQPVNNVPETTDDTFHKRPRWQQTIEQLHEYRDMLASDMLAIWDFRPNVARAKRRLSTEEPINVTERISIWLEETPELPSIPELLDDSVKEKTVIQLNSDCEPDADVTLVEPKSSSTKVTSKAPVRPGKRKYVQGF
ncbi:uncharacterized protein LOC131431697 [Malaya genurostris]|uniref:uncharacterized protein LOC131431697 n=1 Tax=Malaya genurostris TaxID=325434 RepID=UPI0026F3A70D|nr:uncharacterized protein LOC131431697 [Malaya genurostris]